MLTCVRHGESAENLVLHQSDNPEAIHLHRANPPLTDTGRMQAVHTAKQLVKLVQPEQRLLVWTSKLDRAISTAAPLIEELEKTGIAFEYQERLDLNEKKESVVGVKDNETLIEFISRVKKFFQQINIDDSTHLIIVGHSVFISVLTSLMENPLHQFDDLVYFNPNCAITRFVKQQLVMQGSIDHLPIDLRTGVNYIRN